MLATHPKSAMPSTNSFLVNSHCVAALNFHATINTVRLVGSRLASSQNLLTPSASIFSSSPASMRDGGREGKREARKEGEGRMSGKRRREEGRDGGREGRREEKTSLY